MLTIDVGNSRIKWALLQDGNVMSHGAIQYNDDDFEEQLSSVGFPVFAGVVAISHVAGDALKTRLILWLKAHQYENIFFAQTEPRQCGLINSYMQPQQMGVDRWLAMLAAYNGRQRKDRAICVIDCGTAITFDVVDAGGKHLGGLIMPGYRTMCNALFTQTSNIAKVEPAQEGRHESFKLGKNTTDAVQLGCEQLITSGLSKMIHEYEQVIKGELMCVVTGGDGAWVFEAVSSIICGAVPSAIGEVINCQHEPFLIHSGLVLVAKERLIKGS